jgi:broad specificity phosphatase PhoE
MNKIYLVRHGENKANLTKEFSCKVVDYPLTAKGRLQAHQTGQYLRNKSIDVIFTSPLKRAVETAAIIGDILQREVLLSEAFREINVGDLERQPVSKENWASYQNVVQAWLAGFSRVAFPGGENYNQISSRFTQGLLAACRSHPNQNLLIIGHGAIFTFSLPCLCPAVTLAEVLKIENHNASLSEIDVIVTGNQLSGTLIDWANVDHLSGQAAELVAGIPALGDLP